MTSNISSFYDEDGDTPDWLELYNYGTEPLNLEGYSLADKSSFSSHWTFPAFTLRPDSYLLVLASDKDRSELPSFWFTSVNRDSEWKYIIPESEPPTDWKILGFDDTGWSTGKSSFGYGDGDDTTLVPEGTVSVFLRTKFEADNIDELEECLLHVDYDDGFIAYLNGVEIARSGLSESEPGFDALATGHEAVIYSGGTPEGFTIDNFKEVLIDGENVLSVQVHNTGSSSSDLSIIPFISFSSSIDRGISADKLLSISTTYFHTNFKISSQGDSLFLRNPDQEIIDTLYTGELQADISIGVSLTNSDELLLFEEVTPGNKNSNTGYSSDSRAGEVFFSEDPGYYNNPIEVELGTDNETDLIYYTLDGSVPSNTSNFYSTPISIDQSTTLRARVINDNSLMGVVTTTSFMLNAYHDLAVLSLTADPYDFFDDNYGIYVHGPNGSDDFPYFGSNMWQDWERPIHIEFFEPNGELAFAANAGAKIFGGYSRGNEQKSLSIFFRQAYGDGPIDYKIFPEKDLTEYSSLVLRNSGNDWSNSMIRDGLLTTLFHKSLDLQAFRPAAVYLNGEYWGILNIREKVNEHFLANNRLIDPDSIEILEYGGNPVHGTNEHYFRLIDYVSSRNLALTPNYNYVKTQMDVQNYIYYVTANVFINNYDWPASNIKFWRATTEGGKWRWIAYDKDAGFGIWDSDSYSENRLSYMLSPSNDWPAPSWSTQLFRRLIMNDDFKHQFINSYADQLNTTWQPESVHREIDNKRAQIESEIRSHTDRWELSYDYWEFNINAYYTYANRRPEFAREHIIEEFDLSGDHIVLTDVTRSDYGKIRLNTLDLNTFPWSGRYFNDIPISLEAIPKPGHKFLRWEGSIKSASSIINIDSAADLSLKAIFEVTDEEFNHIKINEIFYNSSGARDIDDWVELYNQSDKPINLAGWVLKDNDDTHSFVLPEGTIISGNGYLVICRNLDNFLLNYAIEGEAIGNMSFGLSSGGDCVRLFNTAGDLAEEVCYGVDNPWPIESNGEGASLALKKPNYNNLVAQNWFGLTNNGTPGADNDFVTGFSVELLKDNLVTAYPNPFSSTLNIDFEIKTAGFVEMAIHDLQGKKVHEILDRFVQLGTHHLSWIPEKQFKSGIYVLKLNTADGISTKKVVFN